MARGSNAHVFFLAASLSSRPAPPLQLDESTIDTARCGSWSERCPEARTRADTRGGMALEGLAR